MDEWGESIRWVRPTCRGGRERVRYTERLARSMGSDDDMFRIWSGPEGSSHKEPLSGIRIHRAHGRFFWCRDAVPVPAGCLVSRWSSALPAGSLDYQTARRHRDHFVQKAPVKARLSNLIYPLRNAACWWCLGIDGYVVQESAVLLLESLQLKRLVSLGGETGLFLSLGLWIGEGRMLCRLF